VSGREGPGDERDAHYPLHEVIAAAQEGRFRVTGRVRRHLRHKGWTIRTAVDCITQLRPADFHKSQAHLSRSGAWLDIYRPTYGGCRKYLKIVRLEDPTEFLLLSFCDDGEAH